MSPIHLVEPSEHISEHYFDVFFVETDVVGVIPDDFGLVSCGGDQGFGGGGGDDAVVGAVLDEQGTPGELVGVEQGLGGSHDKCGEQGSGSGPRTELFADDGAVSQVTPAAAAIDQCGG